MSFLEKYPASDSPFDVKKGSYTGKDFKRRVSDDIEKQIKLVKSFIADENRKPQRGERLWFKKQSNGMWGAQLKYSSVALLLPSINGGEGEHVDFKTLKEVQKFYTDAKAAVIAGELDELIVAAQKKAPKITRKPKASKATKETKAAEEAATS